MKVTPISTAGKIFEVFEEYYDIKPPTGFEEMKFSAISELDEKEAKDVFDFHWDNLKEDWRKDASLTAAAVRYGENGRKEAYEKLMRSLYIIQADMNGIKGYFAVLNKGGLIPLLNLIWPIVENNKKWRGKNLSIYMATAALIHAKKLGYNSLGIVKWRRSVMGVS